MAALVEFPECNVVFHVKHGGEGAPGLIVVVAGGRAPAKVWLSEIARQKKICCADRGAQYCLEAGLSPALLVGDCDSAAKEIYAKAESLGAQIFLHPPAKDDTDLQLLLKKMPPGNVVATGIFGGRFDHLFSNVYSLLALKKERGCSVALADEQEFLLLLDAGEKVEISLQDNKAAQAVSLLPLSAECRVSIGGVRWPLTNALLTQARPYAISNEPLTGAFTGECLDGSVGLYISWRK